MYTFSYIDDDDNEFEVTFDYDPDVFGEDDPSQSPWKYIIIDEVTDSEGNPVDFDEDKLEEVAEYLWENYRYEF